MSGNVGTLALPFVVDNTAADGRAAGRAPRRATSAPAPPCRSRCATPVPAPATRSCTVSPAGRSSSPSTRACRSSFVGGLAIRRPAWPWRLPRAGLRRGGQRVARRHPAAAARDELERPHAPPPACARAQPAPTRRRARRLVRERPRCLSLAARGRRARDRDRPPPEGARAALALGDRRALARPGERGGVRRPSSPTWPRAPSASRRSPSRPTTPRSRRSGATPSGWPPTPFRDRAGTSSDRCSTSGTSTRPPRAPASRRRVRPTLPTAPRPSASRPSSATRRS